MWETAKFSPKMAKKTVIFRFFFDFLTNYSYDSNESESEGKRLKPTPLPHMRLWFFNLHELAKIVLEIFWKFWKFYKILLHQIALFGLANWTKKVFPVFPRTIPGETKGSPLPIFFGTARLFSGNFFPKGSPFNFFAVLRQNGCWKNPKGPPFSFFRHCEIFSENKNFCFFNFFMFCDRMDVEKPQRVPLFSFSSLWDFGAPHGPFFSKNFRFLSTIKENTWHLEVFLLFLSLGYGADLGRSRLVFFQSTLTDQNSS